MEIVRVNRSKNKKKHKKITIKDIPNHYPIGTEIVIQVTKGPIGTKGPRTTTNLSLPGRFLVLMPYSDQCGISRKIEDPKERARLKKIIQDLTIPEGMGPGPRESRSTWATSAARPKDPIRSGGGSSSRGGLVVAGEAIFLLCCKVVRFLAH